MNKITDFITAVIFGTAGIAVMAGGLAADSQQSLTVIRSICTLLRYGKEFTAAEALEILGEMLAMVVQPQT